MYDRQMYSPWKEPTLPSVSLVVLHTIGIAFATLVPADRSRWLWLLLMLLLRSRNRDRGHRRRIRVGAGNRWKIGHGMMRMMLLLLRRHLVVVVEENSTGIGAHGCECLLFVVKIIIIFDH